MPGQRRITPGERSRSAPGSVAKGSARPAGSTAEDRRRAAAHMAVTSGWVACSEHVIDEGTEVLLFPDVRDLLAG